MYLEHTNWPRFVRLNGTDRSHLLRHNCKKSHLQCYLPICCRVVPCKSNTLLIACSNLSDFEVTFAGKPTCIKSTKRTVIDILRKRSPRQFRKGCPKQLPDPKPTTDLWDVQCSCWFLDNWRNNQLYWFLLVNFQPITLISCQSLVNK